MNKLIFICIASMLYVSSYSSCAANQEIVVIVHKDNKVELSREVIANIFLGRIANFNNNKQAVPINLTYGKNRSYFNRHVLNKTSIQLKTYWSKMLFTGRGFIPKEVNDDKQMLQLISMNPNLIGYISPENIDDSVRVIAKY